MARRLTRNPQAAVLGGVAAGFADYFDLDPVLVRLGFILLCFLNGIGLLFYVISWVLMPKPEPASGDPAAAGGGAGESSVQDNIRRAGEQVRQAGERVVNDLRTTTADGRRSGLGAGIVLIVIGLAFLFDRLPWLHWPHWVRLSSLWPIVLIGIGAAMIFGARRRTGS